MRPAPKPAAPPPGKMDKLHLEAADFAQNFSIPEAVAYQIVRGDFTLKEWMEKHAEALRKRKERDKVMAVKKQQRSRDEGMAQQYFLKQKRNETPHVFRMHGDEEVVGVVRSILPYHLWLDVETADAPEPKREKLEKLSMLYCFKAENTPEVRKGLKRNDVLAEQKLQPVREKDGRYVIPLGIVQRAAQEGRVLRILLSDGTIVEGTIDWHSVYFMKIKLRSGASVVVFNHGIQNLEIASSEPSAASR